MQTIQIWILSLAMLSMAGLPGSSQQAHPVSGVSADMPNAATYTPVHKFDQSRDAGADIKAAIAEAQRTNKRIILYVGGDWCPYCGELKALFELHPDLLALRESHYITVYVFYSRAHRNQDALAPYGKLLGIPHYFVLNSDGTLLHSQHLLDLRAKQAYSPEKMRQFLQEWAGPTATASEK